MTILIGFTAKYYFKEEITKIFWRINYCNRGYQFVENFNRGINVIIHLLKFNAEINLMRRCNLFKKSRFENP